MQPLNGGRTRAIPANSIHSRSTSGRTPTLPSSRVVAAPSCNGPHDNHFSRSPRHDFSYSFSLSPNSSGSFSSSSPHPLMIVFDPFPINSLPLGDEQTTPIAHLPGADKRKDMRPKKSSAGSARNPFPRLNRDHASRSTVSTSYPSSRTVAPGRSYWTI